VVAANYNTIERVGREVFSRAGANGTLHRALLFDRLQPPDGHEDDVAKQREHALPEESRERIRQQR
jgi:hypothetical protein